VGRAALSDAELRWWSSLELGIAAWIIVSSLEAGFEEIEMEIDNAYGKHSHSHSHSGTEKEGRSMKDEGETKQSRETYSDSEDCHSIKTISTPILVPA